MDASLGTPTPADAQANTQPFPVFNAGTREVTTSVNVSVGESDGIFNTILGGVIAAVMLVLVLLALVVLRYMYRHKGSYHTNEAKGTEFAETANASLRGDPVQQGTVDESKREYFI